MTALVAVFREVRRVLRDDGTVWLNLGDSYYAAGWESRRRNEVGSGSFAPEDRRSHTGVIDGLKVKDLIGVPWMVAFALRADGWYLRSDIIWSKPNPMPESVTDRPTKAHEYVFLLSKRATYHYDADAIREANNPATVAHIDRYGAIPGRANKGNPDRNDNGGTDTQGGVGYNPAGRNKRSVWTIATQPYAGAHFATFPPKLIEPCILAGAPERACGECGAPWVRVREMTRSWREDACDADQAYPLGSGNRTLRATNGGHSRSEYTTVGFEPSCSHSDGSATGVVLDPFAGAGTTGMVALRHGRSFVGAELSPEYAAMARDRIGTAIRLGFRPPQNGTAPIEGQEALFEI